MTVTLRGMSSLRKSYDRYIEQRRKQIKDIRREVTIELVEALIQRIPVWSGRTVRSIQVSAGVGNSAEVHPDRRDTSKDGRWESHPEWSGEAMRDSSESIARASAHSADYSLDAAVIVTSSSYMWAEIDTRSHPYSNPTRHNVVISELALAQIKSKYGSLLK